MDANNYFYDLLSIEDKYSVEGYLGEPFFDFYYKYQSFYRHWILNKEFIKNHLALIKSIDLGEDASAHDLYSETVEVDIEFFPDFLRYSSISYIVSLVENLLGELFDELKTEYEIEMDLVEKKMPYIDKYILWLKEDVGLDLVFQKSLNKNLDAIREIRNRYLHRMTRDIPQNIVPTIQELDSGYSTKFKSVSNEFVENTFEELSNFVKIIELAYIDFSEKYRKV